MTATGFSEDVARALDPRTPRRKLVGLAAHRDSEVRTAVASCVDAPVASLISLALDREAGVREALSAHPSSPLRVITTLATDSKAAVRDRACARLRSLGSAA
jgi:hypothetical protein